METKNEIEIFNKNGELNEEFENYIVFLEDLKNKYTDAFNTAKKKLQKEMENHNVRSISNEKFTISIVDPTTVEDFNKTKFKKEHKDLYDKYTLLRHKDGCLRVVFKNKDENTN